MCLLSGCCLLPDAPVVCHALMHPCAMCQQAAPKTGQHTAEVELVQEALAQFFDGELQCTTTPTSGGVNNVVQVQYMLHPDPYSLLDTPLAVRWGL